MASQIQIKRIFILDWETEFLYPNREGDDLIISPNQLSKIDEHKSYLESIIILAELDWETKHLQDFYGFEIARDLRRKHKLLCPIILTSTIEQSLFEQLSKGNVKFKILLGRGTGFVHIKDLADSLEKTVAKIAKYPLTATTLMDMNQMLLEVKGVVVDQYITHDLRPEKSKTEIEAILNEAAGYLNASQLAALDWQRNKEKFVSTKDNPKEFRKIKEELILRCEQELGAEGAGDVLPEKRHTILLLEDDPSTLKLIRDKLHEHFELVTTNEATEAVEILKKDEGNIITGIISDWRLYREVRKYQYWQLQGYEVLEFAAHNKYIALFALTSLNDRNIHGIRNSLGINMHLFKKQHLEDSGQAQWDLMADTVKQQCDDVGLLISCQPTGKRWTLNYYDKSKAERISFRSLQVRYRDVRISLSWNSFERDVASKANALWDYYKVVFDLNSDSWPQLSSFKEKFSYEIGANEPKLTDTLVVRRIYLALVLSAERIHHSFYRVIWENTQDMKLEKRWDENPIVNAYCVLNGITWADYRDSFHEKKPVIKSKIELTTEEHASEDLLGKSKAMANLLCLTPVTLPTEGILPEEKSWLLSKGIDVSKGISTVDYRADEVFEENMSDSENEGGDFSKELSDTEVQKYVQENDFMSDSLMDEEED